MLHARAGAAAFRGLARVHPLLRGLSGGSAEVKDYYRVLGIPADSTAEQIKHAFRQQGA